MVSYLPEEVERYLMEVVGNIVVLLEMERICLLVQPRQVGDYMERLHEELWVVVLMHMVIEQGVLEEYMRWPWMMV